MTAPLPRPGCRMCGATSYRPVISRDSSGAMRPSGVLRCSGCSLVFTHPSQWRGKAGGGNELPSPADMRLAAAVAPIDVVAGGPFGVKPKGDAGASPARALSD